MYQMSQYGGLESLAQNYKPVSRNYASPAPVFYSIAATASYHDGMFIPSRDQLFQSTVPFQYSEHNNSKLIPYSLVSQNYNFITPKAEYHFSPDLFLRPGKEGIFVGQAEEVRQFVEEAFTEIFQQPFPNNVKISILNRQEFNKITPSPNTVGLSINRGVQGLLSEIFILNDNLGRVMLTIGHELGHVLTQTLANPHDEEAKAYAFSLLWIKKIQEQNIANLGDALITECPADNGLHNVSFHFVHSLMLQGKEAVEIYRELISLSLSLPELALIS